MAPASYTALRFAIAAASPEFVDAAGPVPMDRMLGTDLLVPPAAYEALGKLAEAGLGSWKSPMPVSRLTECRTACPINPVAPGTPSSKSFSAGAVRYRVLSKGRRLLPAPSSSQ